MSDLNRLKRTLQRATGQEEARIRDGDPNLVKILDVIDMTVMARDVHLDNGAGQILSLTVKARRLLRVKSLIPLRGDDPRQLLGVELGQDPAQVTALARLLIRFGTGAQTITATTSAPEHPDAMTDMGVSVDQVRQAMMDAGAALASPGYNIPQTLSEVAASHGLSWALFDAGELQNAQGNAQDLRTAHDSALPYILKAERPKDGQTTTWMLGHGQDDRVSITLQGDACLVARVPVALTAIWLRATQDR